MNAWQVIFVPVNILQKAIYTKEDQKELKNLQKDLGDIEVLYLGEDDMTVQKLMDLNKKWAIENGLCEEEEQ